MHSSSLLFLDFFFLYELLLFFFLDICGTYIGINHCSRVSYLVWTFCEFSTSDCHHCYMMSSSELQNLWTWELVRKLVLCYYEIIVLSFLNGFHHICTSSWMGQIHWHQVWLIIVHLNLMVVWDPKRVGGLGFHHEHIQGWGRTCISGWVHHTPSPLQLTVWNLQWMDEVGTLPSKHILMGRPTHHERNSK